MEPHRYPSYEQAVEQAVVQVSRTIAVDAAVLKALVERENIISRQIEPLPGDVVRGAQEAYVKVFHFVIRNDLLFTLENFLDLLKHATIFSVSLASLFSSTGVGVLGGVKGIVDVLHGLASTYRRITSSGYKLTPKEFAVFINVKDFEWASVSQIERELTGIESEFVEHTLSKYQKTEIQKTGFFETDGQGKWHVVGM